MKPVTLDTGALIAIERQKPRGLMLLRAAREQRVQLLTITPVVAEWWRGRSDIRDRMKLAITFVSFPMKAAEVSAVALGVIQAEKERARLCVDAMVISFASLYGGGIVYTSDIQDFEKLTPFFPSVRVLSV